MNSAGKVLLADSGELFSAQLVEKLFYLFVNGDSSRRSDGGSGLELSLAYKIMKKHDGNLTFAQSDDKVPEGYTKAFEVTV